MYSIVSIGDVCVGRMCNHEQQPCGVWDSGVSSACGSLSIAILLIWNQYSLQIDQETHCLFIFVFLHIVDWTGKGRDYGRDNEQHFTSDEDERNGGYGQ